MPSRNGHNQGSSAFPLHLQIQPDQYSTHQPSVEPAQVSVLESHCNENFGAMLSQQQGKPPVLYPCAFFSRKLCPAERSYNIGNCELLAIKLILEEWRHWLVGAKHQFEVITDHRNLEYLREAKRLNPRQAHGSMSLLLTCPGNKNIKADALSCLHLSFTTRASSHHDSHPVVIGESNCETTRFEPAPPGGPEGWLCVPSALRLSLTDSGL